MTAEKTRQDELLDLLYGELSPQEEAEVRAAIDDDEKLRKEWEELQGDREVVRAAVPEAFEVPEEVTAAILERARVKKPGRRSPARSGAGSAKGGRGIWYDVTMG
ncbi:MAG: anti-sigma factor family protein, partial [Thermodesulfobacteriota bacterium]